MKLSNLSKVVGAAILTCSLAALPSTLPASAQQSTTSGSTNGAADNSTTGGTTTGTTQSQGTDNTAANNDRGFDWGWLGLIGLAGLAGLARKKEEPVRYRDPGTVGTTGGNYRE